MRTGRRCGTGALLLSLFLLGACTADGAQEPSARPTPTAGTNGVPQKESHGVFHGVYVGQARQSKILVAVAATPPKSETSSRDVSVFVCDGGQLVETFAAEAKNDVRAQSQDADTRVRLEVTADAATGTVRLPGGRSVAFAADRAYGASGLYELAVGAEGALTGTTEAGVAASGRITLSTRGKSSIQLADGRRISLSVRGVPSAAGVKAGAGRVIVLPDGGVCGVAVHGRQNVGIGSS